MPDGTPLEFTYISTAADQRQKATQVMQATLAECGVKVNLDYWNEEYDAVCNAAVQSLSGTPEYERVITWRRSAFLLSSCRWCRCTCT